MTLRQIPEDVRPGMRLGRHVHHDPRSLRYAFRAPVALASHRWSTVSTPVLDQGNVGSCTGNAVVGALLCDPLTKTLSTTQVSSLTETLALKFYSQATASDSYTGTYPPTDTGSDGLNAAKAATANGYLSGYTHALSLNDALAALSLGPIIVGIDWYEGFDSPSTAGLIAISGSVRGGHEVCLDEINVANKLVWLRNSWSSAWGVQGRACFSFATFGQLLANQGDATVLAPLSVPAPTPTPVGDPDQALALATSLWVQHKKGTLSNELTRQALIAWRAVKNI